MVDRITVCIYGKGAKKAKKGIKKGFFLGRFVDKPSRM